jgi:UDP-N-acetylglucosamine--dolichyl-phosphate N-acetylglucosaminephosphotransferase
MGLISALVYLLAIVNFLPFAFKRDIAEATFGAGDKNRIIEADELENGRFLHRFPLEKVGSVCFTMTKLG